MRKRLTEEEKAIRKAKHAEYMKRYNQAHKIEIAEYGKQYYQAHKDEHAEKMKEWRESHREENAEYKKQYRQTPKGRAQYLTDNYNQSDKEKGLNICNNITSDYLTKLISPGECVYCGNSDWKALGADRINNDLPHTPDNVVCACGVCNIERQWTHMSVEEFKEYRKEHPILSARWAALEKSEVGALKKRVHVPLEF